MILHNSKSRPVSAGKDLVGIMEYDPNPRSVQSGHTSEAIVHSCFGFLATSHPPLHGSGFHYRPPTAAATIGLTPSQRPGSSNPDVTFGGYVEFSGSAACNRVFVKLSGLWDST